MLPLKSIYITSPYGWRLHPVLKVERYHTGVDLRAFYVPVYSVSPGIVEYAKWIGAYGNAIKINHGAYTSFYAHLKLFNVSEGDIVTDGQRIGTSGNTGTLTTAAHLHFGIYVDGESVDPLKYLEEIMEKAKVVSSYFGTEYDARLIDGKTYVELRSLSNDYHIPITSWNPDTKTATVGGGVIEGIINLAESLRRGAK